MSNQFTLRNRSTGSATPYTTYAAARAAASSGNLIQINASIDEQILLKNGVDILISPGTTSFNADEFPLITDGGDPCVCNIYGGGTLRHDYPGQECIMLSNAYTNVSLKCQSIICIGGDTDSISGAAINISNGARFTLECDEILSEYNCAISVTGESEIFIECGRIVSGIGESTNSGAPVVNLTANGVLNVGEIICKGTGSCLHVKGGLINSKIERLITESTTEESFPTLQMSNGSGTQELILYFNEIQNFNSGEAVKVSQGKVTLIGDTIHADDNLSMNFLSPIISANVICNKIISDTKGINIDNSNQEIIIDANYIEGNIGNDGVIKSSGTSKYMLRNAKITCTDTSSNSVCIYIPNSAANLQTIQIENLILVTGNISTGDTIRRIGDNEMKIKNLGLFVNKEINLTKTPLLIGTGVTGPNANYKYIINALIV